MAKKFVEVKKIPLDKMVLNLVAEMTVLKIELKGIKQQLTLLLNLGPSITQKRMWLDEIMGKTSEAVIKDITNKLKREIADNWNIKFEDLFGKKEDISPEIKKALERLRY